MPSMEKSFYGELSNKKREQSDGVTRLTEGAANGARTQLGRAAIERIKGDASHFRNCAGPIGRMPAPSEMRSGQPSKAFKPGPTVDAR